MVVAMVMVIIGVIAMVVVIMGMAVVSNYNLVKNGSY